MAFLSKTSRIFHSHPSTTISISPFPALSPFSYASLISFSACVFS